MIQVNSYKYYMYEVALARLVQQMVDGQKEIEAFKKKLIKHMKFDSYQIFRSFDTEKRGAVRPQDLMLFMQENEIKGHPKEAEFIVETYTNQRTSMLFKDFLKFMLPSDEPDLMDQVLKQTLSNVKQSDQRMPPYIEHEISILLDMELNYIRQIEKLKVKLAQEFFWSYQLAVQVFMKAKEGNVTRKRLWDFMECNGSGRYLLSDFTYILGRYSKNDSLENELDRKDFGDMVYPYQKFVDYGDESYSGYKTKEEEEANEQFIEKKQQAKQDFDDKFLIIGDFIKDPEYYEEPENLIEFLKNHHYKQLYKNFKDFDFYIEWAKKNIVKKPKKEEKKVLILDYNDIIKQNSGNNQVKKVNHAVWEDGTEKYVPVKDTIQDISHMPHLKDYLKQLKYSMPEKELSLKQILKNIRSDRNMFFYERDDLKFHQKQELFKSIREEQEKQEKRETLINVEVGKQKEEERYQAMKQQFKLFSAFSQYSIDDEMEVKLQLQRDPSTQIMSIMSVGTGSVMQKQKTEESQMNNEILGGGKEYYELEEVEDEDEDEEEEEEEEWKEGDGKGEGRRKTILSGVPLNFGIDAKSLMPLEFQQIQQSQFPVQHASVFSNFEESTPVPEFQYKKYQIGQSSQQQQSNFTVQSPLSPIPRGGQQQLKPLQKLIQLQTANKSQQSMMDDDLKEELNAYQPRQDVYIEAKKTIIEFKLLNAQKRSQIIKDVLNKNTAGAYRNKAVYKKYPTN